MSSGFGKKIERLRKVFNRDVCFSISGNIVEYYDFTLYAFLAPKISHLFFPHDDPLVSLLAALGAFSVSYLARPLGALYFGTIGDRKGRKLALCRSVAYMGGPTFILSITPGYAEIGIWASFTIVFLRIAQGFFMGGEFGGASVFLLEKAEKQDRGIISGILNFSIAAGMLLSILTNTLCSYLDFEGSWRIPFAIGAVISVLSFIVRSYIRDDSAIHTALIQQPIPLIQFIKDSYKNFIIGIMVSGFAGAIFYTNFIYPSIAMHAFSHWSSQMVTFYACLGFLTYAVGSPLFGLLVPKLGIKKMMALAAMGTMLFIHPFFKLLSSDNMFLPAVAIVGLGLMSCFFQVCTNLFLVKSFPLSTRYRGVALSYTVGLAIFGGTVVPILTYLRANHLEWFMDVYIGLLCVVVLALVRGSSLNFTLNIEAPFKMSALYRPQR